MKKTVFIAVTFFLLSSIPCLPQDRTSAEEIITPDPQGFRGISWGQKISDTQNMKRIGSLDFSEYPDIFEKSARQYIFYFLKEWKGNAYVNEKDSPRIGYAVADEIIYLFWKDRFYGAVVESLGNTNRDELEKALILWLGSPTVTIKTGSTHTVVWERKSVRAILDFTITVMASKRDVKLYILSREMESRFIGF